MEGTPLDVQGTMVEGFRRGLESLLEVEQAEAAFFRGASDPLGPELSRALRSGDGEGLPVLLTMARVVAGADLTYWGRCATRRLFVHANTVRYRMRRAEQILGHGLASPKDRVAMTLAAFIWVRHHEHEAPERPEG